MNIFGINFGRKKESTPTVVETATDIAPTIGVDELPNSNFASALERAIDFNGNKFAGGFGSTEIQIMDFWTLRQRSSQLFNENIYAKGLIRRLISNEINTGLNLESMPDEEILGIGEDELNDWTEAIETRFQIWGRLPSVVDFEENLTWGQLQAACRMESLVAGDCLVILRPDRKTGLPKIQLVPGNSVQTPIGSDFNRNTGNGIFEGVEIDSRGTQVAYWVNQENSDESVRIPAVSSRSGRRIAWLVYGSEKRLSEHRGQPILTVTLQSLKEIDRYRDSTQRKAVINSLLAMFIQKNADKPGSNPLGTGVVKKTSITKTDSVQSDRKFNLASYNPGIVIDELQVGEEPKAFGNTGIDLNFGTFEASIIRGYAWCNEIPPEILELSFSNNYSASQAAINEFKVYLNRIRTEFGNQFCQPIFIDWFVSEALLGNVVAPGFLEAWRDPSQYDVFGAWTLSDWSGAIKPSTDIKKQAQGYEIIVGKGWMTNEKASRELTGTKFSRNIKRIKKENEMFIEAMSPLLEFQNTLKSSNNQGAEAIADAVNDKIEAALDDFMVN